MVLSQRPGAGFPSIIIEEAFALVVVPTLHAYDPEGRLIETLACTALYIEALRERIEGFASLLRSEGRTVCHVIVQFRTLNLP